MPDETQRILGEVRAGLAALRDEHSRHSQETREDIADFRAELVSLRLELAEGRGAKRVRSVLGHVVTAVAAVAASLFSGHVAHLPGGH